MKCSDCEDEKHPGLFVASERKRPENHRRRCMKCQRENREVVSHPQPRGLAWRTSARIILGKTCRELAS